MSQILAGPTVEVNLPDISLGEWMFKSLQNAPPNEFILIEGDTDRHVTNKQFLKQSVGFASCLTNYGVRKGDRVALIGGTSIDLTVAATATALIGGVMTPMDPLLRSFEFQHLLKLTKPKLLVCDYNRLSEVRDALMKCFLDIPVIVIDAEKDVNNEARFEKMIQDVPVESFIPASCDDSEKEAGVIVFSSGTTGLPKGVAISQWSCAYQAKLFIEFWPKGKSALHTSYFYWVSGVLMWIATTCGVIQRILVKTKEPTDTLKAIHKYKPAVSMFSPSLLTELMHHPELPKYDISSMACILAGGSPVQKATVDIVKEVLPNALIIQGYGATELGGLVSKTDATMDVMSVGKLAENMKLKVEDLETRAALKADEEGELICWSPTRMMGYYGQNGETKKVLDEEGWYKTGDIGKYTADGLIYITGRAKELLKVDNHQISPSEIEAVILQVDGVQDVAVAGIDVKENSYPMALVVKRAGAVVSEQTIRDIVAETLSDFKQLRAGVHFVESVPRTSTGKLKRRDLQLTANALFTSIC